MKHHYPIILTNHLRRNTGFLRSLKASLIFLTSILFFSKSNAQAITGIVTDFSTYWKSSTSAINPVKPNNSHNLLAFTYNGVQYSTGANDLALSSHGENYIPGDFLALSFAGITGTINSNTKIGLGEMYDGVHNGASNPVPVNNIAHYLSDGIKGLNIGTGVANLPVGILSFTVNTIKPENIGDGIPDVIITQIADPGGSTDSYSFTAANGTIVGNKKNITFTSIAAVGNWTADFYEASANPMTLSSGFRNTDRPLRMWAADLSEFGITAANYLSVSRFSVNLSGNSDLAFVGYNNKTFSVSNLLPVKLSDFSGKLATTDVQLKWTTQTEENSKLFTVERSTGNNAFIAIGTVNAAGTTTAVQQYSFTDKNPADGANYYRLKMIDIDGSFEYSKTIHIQNNSTPLAAGLYPNPCRENVTITHPAGRNSQILIYNAGGIAVQKTVVANNATQTNIHLKQLSTGLYYAVWQNDSKKITLPLMIQ